MHTEAEQILADLMDVMETTVGRNHTQGIQILTHNEEIADMVCNRYNAARRYVMRMRGQPLPPDVRVEPPIPGDFS